MPLSISLESLNDNDWYFVQIADGVWTIPIATGKEIKKFWKRKDVKEFDDVNRKPANGYTLVKCDSDRFISIKPLGSKRISLAHEVQKLKAATKQVLTAT
jgi:hypothetical protein